MESSSVSAPAVRAGDKAVISGTSRDTAVRFQLQPFRRFFEDEKVTEICVNRPGEVFTERAGKWESYEVSVLTFEYLKRLGTAVATYANTTFGDSTPIVSAVLPDGERSQFVMPPACKDGTISITIRKPSFDVKTLESYIESGFFNHVHPAQAVSDADRELLGLREELRSTDDLKQQVTLRARFLQRAVELGKNVVIAGETGSGKTTFMKALMQCIPTEQRIITIEDVPELLWGLPNHRNQVNLLYPSEATENSAITAAGLMRSCLRMKPDRILLAELRGGETFDFLNVCLSGHGGTITSCHAGTCAGVFDYLALKVMQSPVGKSLPHSVIMRLLHLVLDVVVCIHNDKQNGLGRHITEMWYDPDSKKAEGTGHD